MRLPGKSQTRTLRSPWQKAMAPVFDEHDFEGIVPFEGRLPTELRGDLYRIGPGKHRAGRDLYDHWFDGDGMVCRYVLDGESVSFRNRYVRTPWYEAEQRAGRSLYANFGTPRVGALLNARRHRAKNPANTNIIRHHDRLLALWEGGRPFALDPETLATWGEDDLGGGLSESAIFSAHPHRDPRTGELFNVGARFGKVPKLALFRVSPGGRAEQVTRIRLHRPYMVHDFGLTERHAVILCGPLYFEPARALSTIVGTRSLAELFAWHGDEPMRAYVVDRDTGDVRTFELPTGFVVHVANAFEDGDETVIDAAIFEGDPVSGISDVFKHGVAPTGKQAELMRVRFRRDGTYAREPLADIPIEFPRTDDRVTTRAYRCAYGVQLEDGNFLSSKIVKVDTERGTSQVHDFGASCYAGEAVYAPRPGSDREDDGWLLSVVCDTNDDSTFLGVVPADGLGGADIRVRLPARMPLGFHGNFYAAG